MWTNLWELNSSLKTMPLSLHGFEKPDILAGDKEASERTKSWEYIPSEVSNIMEDTHLTLNEQDKDPAKVLTYWGIFYK